MYASEGVTSHTPTDWASRVRCGDETKRRDGGREAVYYSGQLQRALITSTHYAHQHSRYDIDRLFDPLVTIGLSASQVRASPPIF